ncbi:MAG TPA: hypothetical protein VK610_08920, partial [Rhodothermales bacterium]|nr:hypothetical protein [Rhodothermales bacterium]
MIQGVVNDRLEPILALRVRGPSGSEEEVEAVLDTGFDGALSLPTEIIERLGLEWQRRGYALLADGSE